MKTVFIGDVSPTDVTAPLFREKDSTTLFGDTRYLFQGRDLVCANLECALTESDEPIR